MLIREKAKTAVNLNIPDARGVDEEERAGQAKIFPLEEIMIPFLTEKGQHLESYRDCYAGRHPGNK
jgi:hypothetical protein